MVILDALVRGGGITVALLICFFMASRGFRDPITRYGFAFGLGVASHHLCSALWYESIDFRLRMPVLVFCIFNPMLFWLFARALFKDNMKFGLLEKTVAFGVAVLATAFLLGHIRDLAQVADISSVLLRVTSLGLVFHVLFEASLGYTNDLLGARRRLRIYAVGIVGSYILIVVIAELALSSAPAPDILAFLDALSVLVLSSAIAFVALDLREDLFPSPIKSALVGDPPANTDEGARTGFDTELIAKVLHQMEANQIYREESLTVAGLAEIVGTREYLLRRTINQGLGQRNFAGFLNGYRLKEIEGELADSEKSRVPILTIALDAGFNSIGPFNRVFKEKHGITPSEFRHSRLAAPDSVGAKSVQISKK